MNCSIQDIKTLVTNIRLYDNNLNEYTLLKTSNKCLDWGRIHCSWSERNSKNGINWLKATENSIIMEPFDKSGGVPFGNIMVSVDYKDFSETFFKIQPERLSMAVVISDKGEIILTIRSTNKILADW